MKKIKLYILFLLGLFMASCHALDLGPIDQWGLNNYWKTQEQCERFMIGLHFRLRTRMETMMILGEIRGGTLKSDAITSTGEGAYHIEAINNNLSSDKPGIKNWGDFYMDIYQINHAIDKISTGCGFLNDKIRDTYLGQLYGMRALYYFHLLRTWGGVPLCDYPDVLVTDNISVLDKPRASERETWKFIRNDIDKSCEYFNSLDFSHYDKKNCFWNKAASNILKAEVYLWGAKVKPISEKEVFSSDINGDLGIAKNALLEAEPHYSLNLNFTDAFSVKNKDANKETVLAARYSLGESSNFYGSFTYNIAIFTKYFDKDGNKLVNPLNISSGNMRYEYSEDLWNSFVNSDKRRDATFLQFYLKNNEDELYPAGRALCKFLGDKKDGKIQYTNDVIIYRYADIALLLSEIYNELGDKDKMKEWIDVVRTRAGCPGFIYTDKEAAEQAILDERKLEFVAEGKYWYDARRMLGGKHALSQVGGNELKLLWPIDSDVLSKDKLVTQNKGYL